MESFAAQKIGSDFKLTRIDRLEKQPRENSTEEILTATQKVVDVCRTHDRLSVEFNQRFTIENGFVSRKDEKGIIIAREPKYILENYKKVLESGTSKEDADKWLTESSLENLVTWIGLAAEVHPAILGEINDDLDLNQFGLQVERTLKLQRPKVLVQESETKIAAEAVPEGLKKIRDKIRESLGDKVCNSILICGGVARDVICGKDSTIGGGDLDYAIFGDISTANNDNEQVRERIKIIVSQGCQGSPDEITDSQGIFGMKMKEKGWKDIFEALDKNVTFSIDSIAVNLGTGEIYDPHSGIDDMRNGILKLVGEEKEKSISKSPEKALILALRGAKYVAQYGFETTEETQKIFTNRMEKNKLNNRARLISKGLNRNYSSAEIAKIYVKMLSKAQDAMLIVRGLEEFGVLDQVSGAINTLNSRVGINWREELLTIRDLLWQRDYKAFAHGKMIGKYDIRHVEKPGKVDKEKIKFISTTVMLARAFNYLVAGKY